MQFETPALFAPSALDAVPPDVARRARGWSETCASLVDAVNNLEAARERASAALQQHRLPDPGDRRAGPRLREALGKLLEHLHALEEIRQPVAEALVKTARSHKERGDKALSAVASKLVTAGFDEPTALRCAILHPTVKEHRAASDRAACAQGQLPTVKAGSVLKLAVRVENELAALEN